MDGVTQAGLWESVGGAEERDVMLMERSGWVVWVQSE